MKRQQVEDLIYGDPKQRQRFTQDFPVLPDVWIEYGVHPGKRVGLLLTPHTRSDAPSLARALRDRLKAEEEATQPPRGKARTIDIARKETHVIFNESVVFAELSFAELIRVVMPLTDWWARVIAPIAADWSHQAMVRLASARGSVKTHGSGDPKLLAKMMLLAGSIEFDRLHPQEPMAGPGPGFDDRIRACADLLDGLTNPQEKRGFLWGVSKNREADTSLWRSRNTVKADAAARLFQVDTTGIRWAVLDTGIDATHPAFMRRDAEGKQKKQPDTDEQGNNQFPTRVVRSYDFLRIKDLLDPDTEIVIAGTAAEQMDPKELDLLRQDLVNNLERGRAIDWNLIEPFLRIPQTNKKVYKKPTDPHGTHVAGIIAANWPDASKTALQAPLMGMCPDLELFDLRVLGERRREDDGRVYRGDEFTIIAALQFVRHLNAHRDEMAIHGVNLSMSVPHDVANYACGRTPVCEECERVVANGVVVVTAAGNRGFNKLAQPEGGAQGDYRYISITDPGNSQNVITVGSTHRFMPHNYGVSYFSSRGPTGDGRSKPDLVAPGERIDSCTPEGKYETMDGTSMAAPHVSGAAALLIGRNRELIGQPTRVKDILCRSATDLGREPRFQGAGMVDVLRAMQSV
jgi:serine protease AprX